MHRADPLNALCSLTREAFRNGQVHYRNSHHLSEQVLSVYLPLWPRR